MARRTSRTCGLQGGAQGEETPPLAARAAGLRYVTDAEPGIRRERHGKAFRYRHPDDNHVVQERELARIRSLAIPPAWTDVWICATANGHLQATGRDARGRKQYRYHTRWRSVRDETKYTRLSEFGAALPALRAQVDRDLLLRGLPKAKVVATVVRLLETTLIRVGNEEYAMNNRSFGLTTMRDRHVGIDGRTVEFRFRGKSGKPHRVSLQDRRLATVVRRCRDIPGHELFQYIDDAGQRQSIDSADVNAYIRAVTGEDFTAKDFRTWAGTVLAAVALGEFEPFESEAQAKSNVVSAICQVAARLGNTPAVCRKCYVHPAVVDAYLEGTVLETGRRRTEDEHASDGQLLSPEEAAVLRLLRRRTAVASVSNARRRSAREMRVAGGPSGNAAL